MKCILKFFAGAIGISGLETALLRSHGGEASAGRADPAQHPHGALAELCVRL